METKTCTNGRRVPGCGQELPVTDFKRNAKGAPLPQCRFCMQKYRRLKKNYPETLLPPPTSVCAACQEEKPSADFVFADASGGKLNAECKKCQARKMINNSMAKMRERNLASPSPNADGEKIKACPQCSRELPLTAFWVDLRKSSGRDVTCGECRSKRAAERRKGLQQ